MRDDVAARATRLSESVRLAKEFAERGGSTLGRTDEPATVSATSVPTDSAFRVFAQLLDAHGLRYALYSILRLTDYRYISVFRFDHGMVESLAHVDRENLAVVEAPPTAESDTYCRYVRADGAFASVDSTLDLRTEGHAKRQALRAYCGVPIMSADGRPLGTLCHYDPLPRDPAQLDASLLAQVAEEIVRRGLMTPPVVER